MTEKELQQLIKQGESQNIEFKSSLSLRNEIGETISAFANTSGGIILIGVSDEKKILGVVIGRKTGVSTSCIQRCGDILRGSKWLKIAF